MSYRTTALLAMTPIYNGSINGAYLRQSQISRISLSETDYGSIFITYVEYCHV